MQTIINNLTPLLTLNLTALSTFLLCMFGALIAGLIMAIGYTIKNRYTKSFILTIALLPAIVCVVIMVVNGNIGAGIAVMGAFSLVRFRSAPGTAKEIIMIFSAMGAGLLAGMGSLIISLIFSFILTIIFVLCNCITFGKGGREKFKVLTVTIPEDLDYAEIFDDVFSEYTSSHELIKVKTTNMGSMFRLTYNISLKDPKKEKAMIDMLRERNGNLDITLSIQDTTTATL
ncbi:MAG: DUF4956 domain-containing protein [Ruminococcaceae bacterium]|nr:DUF4956 domain-containing protein [Oscillospiraceae bacterium]